MSTFTSLSRYFKAPALLALGLTAVACGGDATTPTAPTAPTASTAPTSPATTANLAGTWVGTASVKWDEIDGGGGCSGPVTVIFSQSGPSVSTTLPAVSDCIKNPMRFDGTIVGDVLQGNIVFPTFTWPTRGQVSDEHVTMMAVNVSWDLRR
jgi:hypothetical protein